MRTAIDKYAELPVPVKDALLTTVKKSANDNIWVCEADGITTSVAVKTVPPKNSENYSKIHLLAVSQTQAKVFAAMCEYIAFKEKALITRFGDKELLLKALKHISISGSVKEASHKTQTIAALCGRGYFRGFRFVQDRF